MTNARWRKIKKSELGGIEGFLRENESRYVSACGRFLKLNIPHDSIWAMGAKGMPSALIINSRNSLLPVFCGRAEMSFNGFTSRLNGVKKPHSIQGIKNEAELLESVLRGIGWKSAEDRDYDLMYADKVLTGKNYSAPVNLVLRTPAMTDLDAIAALQAGYEREEVLPKGAEFSPASSRLNAANIIASLPVLAAEIDGRLVGKINVSAISFTKYQIGGVYVHPDFRGVGIGRKMTEKFMSSLSASATADCGGFTLFVKKTNTAARRLYDSLGFSVIGDYRISYY